jgi:probable blue pigment (indigoidine) exporter
MLAAALRALPAGILLTLIGRSWPHGAWWWRSGLLGLVNIAAFFALLFIAAERLPGGVASTIVALQPLIVVGLSRLFLADDVSVIGLVAGCTGVAGVAMLVLPRGIVLDPVGVTAAAGAAVTFAVGVVLIRHWGKPPSLLAMTGWQLLVGGIVLLPVTAITEGFPGTWSAANVVGFGYLGIVGTAIAYVLWFRGIVRLRAWLVSFLALLSPVVAIVLGLAVRHERLTTLQALGMIVVVGSLVLSQTSGLLGRRQGIRSRGGQA